MKYINVLFYAPLGAQHQDEEYGYAYVFEAEGGYAVEYFQSRLNLKKEESEMFDDLLIYSKSWFERSKTVLGAINIALKFWGRKKLKALPEIKVYQNVAEAIKANPGVQEIYYQETESAD